MNEDAHKGEPGLAASIALGEAAKNPEMAARTAKYLDEQIALSQAQREQAQRDASLHALREEHLKLQNEALHSQQAHLKTQHEHAILQKSRLRAQRLHDRLRSVYQSVLSLLALVVLALIVYAVYDAATDQSVVVTSFQVPPSFAQAGNSGTVVASDFLDQLQTLQAASPSGHATRSLSDAWSNDIQLQIPEAGVSLGDVRRSLHAWLGHETRISGNIVQQGDEIALTVRGNGFAARTFSGNADDLPKLLTAAAEYVYGQAEPYLLSLYLDTHGRDAQAIAGIKAAWPTASSQDRPWLLLGWGNALQRLNRYEEAGGKYAEAIRIDPHFWLGYMNLQWNQALLGQEQAAYQTGVRMERAGRRGSWLAIGVDAYFYSFMDYLRKDLPAVHRELEANIAAHGGVGSNGTANVPLDAEMLARMHAQRQASLTLQTAPGAGTDPYVLTETAFVQGIMALDRRDYAQAVSDFRKSDTLFAQNPTQQLNFPTPPVCYLGLALEFAGQPDQADAAITRGGHFVDCYRFKADIADHRGNWPQAQKDYAAAVALAPSLPMAYDSWGLALMHHHDYAGAIVKFEAANQRGPHWCDPLKHWGDALAAQGKYKEAIEKYAQAAKYTPHWGALELHWAQALDKLGKHKQALTHYRSAITAAAASS